MAGLNKLTVMKIKNAKEGVTLQDGGGLMFVRTTQSSKWIYRYSFQKRRRDMGLGSLSDVSLADARRARARWAAVLLSGLDPISERQRVKDEQEAALSADDPTFEEMAHTVF